MLPRSTSVLLFQCCCFSGGIIHLIDTPRQCQKSLFRAMGSFIGKRAQLAKLTNTVKA
ncbi:hypothetical protein PULV_b0152 [Pseudoalteromonas ulvae UL12]|nr:hypothetical protein [Pseudoalteromonas ulvae UL12]